MQPMNIGAAAASGVSAKMIRHYEELGLIPKARRTMSGYRMCADADVHTLRFIREARDLGFSTKHTSALLGLWRDRRRPDGKVRQLAQQHIEELDRKLAVMHATKATLEHLVHCCHGDDRPECPILETLSTPVDTPENPHAHHGRRGTLRGGARGG